MPRRGERRYRRTLAEREDATRRLKRLYGAIPQLRLQGFATERGTV